MAQRVSREQLADLLAQGLTGGKIAERLGMSETNVHYWLKKHQLCLSARHQQSEAHAKACTKCGQIKALEGFAFRNKRLGKRASWCRNCSSAAIRTHYADHPQYYIDKARKRTQAVRKELARRILDYLTGKQCVDCGERDPLVLEFDHVRGEKLDAVSSLVETGSWETVLSEISKCDIRCVNCHRHKTALEKGFYKARGKDHSDISPSGKVEQKSEEAETYQELPVVSATKKVCTKCGEEKAIEEFVFKNKITGSRQSRCRDCCHVVSREHYARNKQIYKDRSRERRGRVRTKNTEKLREYLSDKRCVDCGEEDPLVLEFDHVRGQKQGEVSALVCNGACGWGTILAEIAKCEIRCGNCHRRKTAKERGWYRARLDNE